MLEGLDDVNWVALEHAYGSAADVPDLIRALRSPKEKVRKEARWALYGNVFHQGTRYEASAYAVPFLLEVLADSATPDREAVLELLTALAVGYDENWLPDGFPVAQYRTQADGGEELLRAAPDFTGEADEDESDRRYEYFESLSEEQEARLFAFIELAVYDAARAGVPLFRTLLTDDDPGVRTGAAYALAWFSEDGTGSVPALSRAAVDPEPAVAATALVALGLVGAGDDAATRVAEAALADPREGVRWGAAIASARLRGRDADPRAITELLTWSSGAAGKHDGIPFLDGDLGGYAGLALRQFGESHADVAFDALLVRIPCVSGTEALVVVAEALRRAFPSGPVRAGTPFTALDESQQRLLGVLADSPGTWGYDDFPLFGNFSLLMGGYGLPHNPDAMRAYRYG